MRTTSISCMEINRCAVSTSYVQRCMMSPVWFSVCHENGRRWICAEQRVAQPFYMNILRAFGGAQPVEIAEKRRPGPTPPSTPAAHRMKYWRAEYAAPAELIRTARSKKAGSAVCSLPITESTVKPTICGIRNVNRILKTAAATPSRKYRLPPSANRMTKWNNVFFLFFIVLYQTFKVLTQTNLQKKHLIPAALFSAWLRCRPQYARQAFVLRLALHKNPCRPQ